MEGLPPCRVGNRSLEGFRATWRPQDPWAGTVTGSVRDGRQESCAASGSRCDLTPAAVPGNVQAEPPKVKSQRGKLLALKRPVRARSASRLLNKGGAPCSG